jgi:hypothetical protein
VHEGVALLIGLVVFILGGVILMITAMNNRRRLIEIAHSERVAMIQRGLVPSPEVDPAAFEAGARLGPRRSDTRAGERYRTAGVIMIGMGLGMMVLLTFAAGEPDIGLGVGGAWAVLGAASLLNYFLISRRDLDNLTATQWRAPSDRETPKTPRPDGSQ